MKGVNCMKKYFLLSFMLLVITFYFIITNQKAEKTLTYFPIDYEQKFTLAMSSLTPINQTDTIKWISESSSEKKLYLRQDISLLFNNGNLYGVLNKWAQHVDKIKQSEHLNVSPNTMLQAISLHHGEHHENGKITSIQEMSTDTLYILKNKSIRIPSSTSEQQIVTSLHEKVNEELTKHWNKLINHFQINSQNYVHIPLDKLENLHDYLPHTVSTETKDRIIGQLWEGLYKNYVLQAIETKSNDLMPLVLLANDYSHLFVLYTMNGEKMQLIQQLNIEAKRLTE